MKTPTIFLLFALLFLSACLPIGTLEVRLETQEAPVAEPSSVPEEEIPTPEGEDNLGDETGSVRGGICYPSEYIPAMSAYFLDSSTNEYTEMAIDLNQASYEITLPVGTYTAFAWYSEYSLGGGYTQAVPCGLHESCTDHNLLSFEVLPDIVTSGIDLCDWILTNLPLPAGAVQPTINDYGLDLSGLVYVDQAGLWQIGADGQTRQIYARPETILSPDGKQALSWFENDLWLLDIASGEIRNLTNTPDRIEYLPRSWKSRADLVLFNSIPVDMEVGPGITGFLTMVKTDGTGYRILDEINQGGNFEISPDGQSIAYGAGPVTYLYRWTTGREAFNPADYGLSGVTSIFSPSWSPDGSRIAWMASGLLAGTDQFAIVFFDLEPRAAQIVHGHQIPGMDGFPAAGQWSPDGQWYLIYIFDMDQQRNGTWVVSTDPNHEESVLLGKGYSAVWSPDGSRIAILDDEMGGLRLFVTGVWSSMFVEFTQVYSLSGWIAPE